MDPMMAGQGSSFGGAQMERSMEVERSMARSNHLNPPAKRYEDATSPLTKSAPGVHELLDAELKRLSCVHETVSQLEQRLGTVLDCVPPSPSGGGAQGSVDNPYSVADKVRLLIDVTNILEGRLASILNRVNL